MITRTEEQHCPCCGYKLNSLGDPGETLGAPRPGDTTICIRCAEPLIITEGFGLRKPTAEESIVLAADPEVQAVRRRVFRVMGLRN